MTRRSMRRTKAQQQEITRQMLAELRRLTQQDVSIHEVRKRVGELRDDLVQANRLGVTLTRRPENQWSSLASKETTVCEKHKEQA